MQQINRYLHCALFKQIFIDLAVGIVVFIQFKILLNAAHGIPIHLQLIIVVLKTRSIYLERIEDSLIHKSGSAIELILLRFVVRI